MDGSTGKPSSYELATKKAHNTIRDYLKTQGTLIEIRDEIKEGILALPGLLYTLDKQTISFSVARCSNLTEDDYLDSLTTGRLGGLVVLCSAYLNRDEGLERVVAKHLIPAKTFMHHRQYPEIFHYMLDPESELARAYIQAEQEFYENENGS